MSATPLTETAPVANVANALTLGRLLIVPAVVALVFAQPEGSLAAAALFALASATDALDGHLARSRNLVTRLGKLMDPLADKALVLAALGSLVLLDRLALWVALVILVREALVTALRTAGARRGLVVPASRLGKLKMGLQVLMVLVLLAIADPTQTAVAVVVYATVGVTVLSGLDYALHLRARADRPSA